jgi:hypothetical protein
METVRELIAIVDDLRTHAERMIRTGASAEEAERRYIAPPAFQAFRNSGSYWTVGAAMESLYRTLAPTG